MKWKTPNLGDRKARRYFALCPLECDDGQTRWLCWLDVIYEYQTYYDGDGPADGWCIVSAKCRH